MIDQAGGMEEKKDFPLKCVWGFCVSEGTERQRHKAVTGIREVALQCVTQFSPGWDCQSFTDLEYHQIALEVPASAVTSGQGTRLC